MHPEFAPVAFLSAASLALPLPWHWRAGNVATLSIIAWLFIMNMIYGINAVIWAGSARITAVVYCDITTKLTIGGNFALPAACLCLCIHLERVASVRAAQTTAADKRRRTIFELAMCWLLPIIFMALHYVVQGHRFDIVEDFGCRPATYYSIPAIFIVWVPPLTMAAASLVYASLAIRHFMHRRLSFAMHLQARSSALTTSRYLRLILMAIVQLVWLVVTTAYTLWFSSMTLNLRPWTTWADVHSNFGRIQTWPAIITPAVILRGACTLWWMVPASTWIFVAFFAFGNDAVEEYKRVLNVVLSGARRALPEGFLSEKKRDLKGFSLPSFVKGSVPLGDSSSSTRKDSLPDKAVLPVNRSVTMTTTTSTVVSSMPPPYSLPPPPPPQKYTSPLDSLDYSADADRISISSSVDTSGYTIEILPETPSTSSSTPPSPSSPQYPRSPSSQGSHVVDDYYYTSSPQDSLPHDIPAPPSLPPPTHMPDEAHISPSHAVPSRPPAFPPYPFARDMRPAASEPMSPRPITYPSMSPTHRDIASVFPGGRR
uniref:Pheromone B beta 1 receptor n=1 Tax=Schizophyllum commune TaxID=5334 RepID=BBR1_SCHCO|nr:RecName: Full=Pheromone B beta 1 receptor [Schizophyllum commune]AAB41858.2 B beta 1 pheromone receptor [Schizophyllum commune]